MLFSRPHGTQAKKSLNKFDRGEIIQSMVSDHNRPKLEFSNNKYLNYPQVIGN